MERLGTRDATATGVEIYNTFRGSSSRAHATCNIRHSDGFEAFRG
jgi:hypothetical protein